MPTSIINGDKKLLYSNNNYINYYNSQQNVQFLTLASQYCQYNNNIFYREFELCNKKIKNTTGDR